MTNEGTTERDSVTSDLDLTEPLCLVEVGDLVDGQPYAEVRPIMEELNVTNLLDNGYSCARRCPACMKTVFKFGRSESGEVEVSDDEYRAYCIRAITKTTQSSNGSINS